MPMMILVWELKTQPPEAMTPQVTHLFPGAIWAVPSTASRVGFLWQQEGIPSSPSFPLPPSPHKDLLGRITLPVGRGGTGAPLGWGFLRSQVAP